MKDKYFEKFKNISESVENNEKLDEKYDAIKSMKKRKRELINTHEFIDKNVEELAQQIVFLRLENEMLRRKLEVLDPQSNY
jgi:regulator of replication initiation timing